MLHGHGSLGSDHVRFLAASLPRASSIPAAVTRPIVDIQGVCHGPVGSLRSYASYCHPLTLVNPNPDAIPCKRWQHREQRTLYLCGNCKPVQRPATTDRTLVMRLGQRFESAPWLSYLPANHPKTKNPQSGVGALPALGEGCYVARYSGLRKFNV